MIDHGSNVQLSECVLEIDRVQNVNKKFIIKLDREGISFTTC